MLVIELDGKPVLTGLLDGVAGVEVRHLSAAAALAEYLVEHGFRRVAKRLAATGVIDVVSAAAPGIEDLVVLGKIKQLERAHEFDTIVVDGPAAGHAVRFLTSPAGLLDSMRSGPVHAQAADVTEMLHDPERCRVVLVTLPEHTPVNELIETAFTIEDRAGVQLGAVIVNGVDAGPPLPLAEAGDDLDPVVLAAARYRQARRDDQAEQLGRVRTVVPLPVVVLPFGPLDAQVEALA